MCIQFVVAAGPEPIPAVIGQEAGYSPDRLPIYGRINTERQETVHLHTFTPTPKSPVNLMPVFGRMKLDYQRGTNPDLGDTD